MSLWEKYWLTIWFVFLRYFSVLMIGAGIGFIVAGHLVNPWWYAGLAVWPLLIMWGIVNFKYIHVLSVANGL